MDRDDSGIMNKLILLNDLVFCGVGVGKLISPYGMKLMVDSEGEVLSKTEARVNSTLSRAL